MSSTAWKALQEHYKAIANTKISDFFIEEPERFEKFSIENNEILLDYSKQPVTDLTIRKLIELCKECRLQEAIQMLLSGGIVNSSEQRPALHTALRDLSMDPLIVDGSDIKPAIHRELERLEEFVDCLREGQHCGASGKPITDVLCLGIGGSDLGPSMVCEALVDYKITDIRVHFISNVDGKTLARQLRNLDPFSTLCVINSKTFTTSETLKNAQSVKKWFEEHVGNGYSEQHLVGVSAAPKRAKDFGVKEKNIFCFWDFVGGRYSIWSSVGLPIALLLGMSNFKAFLSGAHEMDTHFSSSPFHENMPVLMAILGIWNINFFGHETQAIIPYEDGLQKFPSYLQQLEMESNGKKASKGSGFVSCATAPVLWGGVGCNSQHAYMQLLHQGTQVVPVDFLIAATGEPGFSEQHQLLVASCLSQSKALMEGNDAIDPKRCFGNRPSTTLMYKKLSPSVLGALIALYEHKVFVQGVLWGINSFDQWGVELGKQLVGTILPSLAENSKGSELDSSTKGLIDFFQKKTR